MKKLTMLILTLTCSVTIMAQGHGLSIGIKGGLSDWKAKDVSSSSLGGYAGVDIGYQCMWRMQQEIYIGLRTGAGIAYQTGSYTVSANSQFTNTDYLGNQMDYSIRADVKADTRQLNVDIPIMFATRIYGFALNIGPRLHFPVYDTYKQELSNTNVDVYYPRYDIPIHNDPSLAKWNTADMKSDGNKAQPIVMLSLSAEIGYEWALHDWYTYGSEQYIGLQLFVDYGLWGTYAKTKSSMMTVEPISRAGQIPEINVGNIADAGVLAKPLTFGVRLYYTFQSTDYSGHGWNRGRR